MAEEDGIPSEGLAAHREELRQLARLTGCRARASSDAVLDGADTDQSDLDLLVDPAESTGFLTLAAFKIDLKLLWTAVRDDLPRLQRQIDDLLTRQRRSPA